MAAIWVTWRRESRRHSAVRVLTFAGLLGFVLGPVLAVAGLSLLGQFVAGVSVAPLALVVYLCLLSPASWPGGGDGGRGPGRGDDPPEPPDSPDEPGGGVDWERFERDFWAHVDEHVLVS